MPPGTGKSRVIAAIIYLLGSTFEKFRVLFSHPELKRLEMEKLQKVADVNGVEIEGLIGTDKDAGVVDGETLLIIDEADSLLVDSLIFLDAANCVALTATALPLKLNIEITYLLKTLGFTFYSSGIQSELELVEDLPDMDIWDFLRDLSRPKLIFGGSELLEEIEEIKLQVDFGNTSRDCFDVLRNTVSHEVIRDMKPGQVFFVDKPDLMRGFDYNTACAEGIDLLMGNQLPTERAIEQALGRVGRYHTPSRRYRLSGLDLLDQAG